MRLGAVLGGGAAPVVRWEYTKKAGDGGYDAAWTHIAATSKTLDHRITGLAAGTAYRFKVRAVNATGAGAASAASDAATPRVETLTASAVEAATATLTLAGHDGGAWYWKRITPSGDDTCTMVQSGVTTASLSSLPKGTSHTYKAYSDSACTAANELASETFLTKPGQVAGVTVTAGAASLNVDWTARTDTVTGYKVQWKSSNDEDWSATRQTTATTHAAALTGLTDATTYTIRVAATNATGDGAWSGGGDGYALGERDDPDRERDPGHDRHPDHRQPHRRLALEVHRAGDARGRLLHGGEHHGGEPDGARGGQALHLQGVRRRRLHDHGAGERPAPDPAGAGDGIEGGGAAPVAGGGLERRWTARPATRCSGSRGRRTTTPPARRR